MNAIAQILAIQVTLQGVSQVTRGLEMLAKNLNVSKEAVKSLRQGMQELAVVLGLVYGGIKQVSQEQTFLARAEGLSGSEKIAQRQLAIVKEVASHGVFAKNAVMEAIGTLQRFGDFGTKNLELVEKLGARTGDIQGAANLVGMIQAGFREGLGRRLKEFGIGPQMLRGAGLSLEGFTIHATTSQILSALEKIESTDKTLSKLQNNVDAGIGRMIYQLQELIKTIGEPLVGPFTHILKVITEMFRWMGDLNKATNGWVSNFLVGGLLLGGLSKVLMFLKEISIMEKVIAVWAALRSALQAGPALLAGLANVIKFLFSMRAIEAILVGIETVRAFLAAALAAALGNWAGVAAALILIGAAGVAGAAAINGVNNYRNSQAGQNGADVEPAQRPVRRDDIERIYQRAMGDVWTT